MLIKLEELVNKKIFNLYLPQAILIDAPCLLVCRKQLYKDKFCNNLAQINDLEYCLITPQILSVKYQRNKEDVSALVMAEIDDLLQEKISITEHLTFSDINCAEAIADAFIRPTLNRDNGDINILSLSEGQMQIEFTGHCSGCPYAQNTLQNIIMKVFMRYMPTIKQITLKE